MASKEELERRKLELEIAELARRWWARPPYLAALLSLVAAILLFLAGLLSGYFDRERSHLKEEISQLKAERESLKQEVDRTTRFLELLDKTLPTLDELTGSKTTPSPPQRKSPGLSENGRP
jgi:cell division protein FtsB